MEHVAKNRKAYKVSAESHEGKRPLGRRRYKGEDDSKMYRDEIEWERVDSPGSRLEPVVGCLKDDCEIYGSIKCW
jgi:hypothetical protein